MPKRLSITQVRARVRPAVVEENRGLGVFEVDAPAGHVATGTDLHWQQVTYDTGDSADRRAAMVEILDLWDDGVEPCGLEECFTCEDLLAAQEEE